eukprot:GHVQ01021519.1.p1 GENE.GHVQ01021519.1~~GHVQ01021519.1.p1  ORF type:complete len:106 (+),score=13.62 GHVQ01021519.1:210-527(+)
MYMFGAYIYIHMYIFSFICIGGTCIYIYIYINGQLVKVVYRYYVEQLPFVLSTNTDRTEHYNLPNVSSLYTHTHTHTLTPGQEEVCSLQHQDSTLCVMDKSDISV